MGRRHLRGGGRGHPPHHPPRVPLRRSACPHRHAAARAGHHRLGRHAPHRALPALRAAGAHGRQAGLSELPPQNHHGQHRIPACAALCQRGGYFWGQRRHMARAGVRRAGRHAGARAQRAHQVCRAKLLGLRLRPAHHHRPRAGHRPAHLPQRRGTHQHRRRWRAGARREPNRGGQAALFARG